ncbi:M56 family metallopeptidase [Panacibacter ginsenosidivorans]|uniref:M56 family metallopeptidase n=1 Tax=Panacibacter ginsenosidivorans TaxID=1813871 RepID=A0A5B8V6Z2_9BACT|nr:M56 family metallopeptidase [Panacibacter ginsenosidivorans]QEC66531.1 M56 family metallopeptidase [Panacibacter ginsenosidivorans]
MQSLLQSAFLQALGYAIFNSLWQVALLWIIVMLVNNVGKLSSSKRYFTGVTAQFAGFVWFLFTLQFYYKQCSDVIANAQSAGIADNNYSFYEPAVNNLSSGLMYVIIKTEQLLPYLSVAYLFMLLFLAVRLTRAYLYIKKIQTEGLIKADVEWRLFVKRTAGYLGINKNVTFYFSELVKSPLTLGFAKPLILVPIASLNHLTPDQLEAILLHELAHIKRADYLINIIITVIEVALFFNPFTQLLGKLIKKERENSCDDWVLQFQYKPAMYAEALLRIAYIQTQPSFAMQASGNKGELLPRVKRMLNQQEKTHQYRNHLFALLLITVMLTTVAWFNPAANNAKRNLTPAANNRKTLVEPFTATVDNPLYNPFYYLFAKPLQTTVEQSINIAANKASKTLPAATDIVKKVTPIAMQTFREIHNDIENELPSIQQDAEKAMSEAKTAITNIKIGGVSLTDSTAIEAAINNLAQKELAKIDWKSMNNDLRKAKAELVTATSESEKELTSEIQINDVLEQVTKQMQTISNKTNISLNTTNFLKSLLDKKLQSDLIKEQLQLKQIQEQKKKEKEQKRTHTSIVANKPLKVWSDMKRDDYIFNVDESTLAELNFKATPKKYEAPAPVSTVAYTDYLDTISETDTIINPDAAIIIIQHNPENIKSHIKHINVQIVGNNGVTKSYTFTVDVCQ